MIFYGIPFISYYIYLYPQSELEIILTETSI